MVEPGYERVIYEKKEPIAYITLNEPDKLNRLSGIGIPGTPMGGMLGEIERATIDIKNDDNMKVFIMKGAGRCFAAGYNIDEAEKRYDLSEPEKFPDAAYWDEIELGLHRFYERILWNNPKPSIGRVHGYCLAGACHMLCYADCVICSEDAVFGHPAVRFGAVDAHQLFPSLLGMRKAKELLMTGNFMSSAEALRVGFVNKVVPREKLDEEVNKLALSIAAMPPRTASYNKFAINRWYEAAGMQQAIYEACALDGEEYGSTTLPGHLRPFYLNVAKEGLKSALEMRDRLFRERDKEIAEENKREAKQLRALYEERMK